MDIIDNLIFAVFNKTNDVPPQFIREEIESDYIGIGAFPTPTSTLLGGLPNFSYSTNDRDNFVHLEDTAVIERAMQKHWFDIGDHLTYPTSGLSSDQGIFSDLTISPYHLIYAYLIENTRIVQIFEKVISLSFHDEVFGMPEISSNINAMQWLVNTENLFYKELPQASYRNISSQLRVFPEATRRNAYFRMFGMDLAFGDFRNQNSEYPYIKANGNNSGFVALFEQFLAEIWQAYINAKNTSGANTTDFEHLTELGTQLRDMLMSRRTSKDNFDGYKFFNLSKEEYSSVLMTSWLMNILTSNDTSIIKFLKCEASSADERLLKIGLKVGLPAHSKTKALMELAAPLAALLRNIENKTYEDLPFIIAVLTSQTPNPSDPANVNIESATLNDLLTIINNWEKATGHRIKNPEGNIIGTVRIAPQQRPNGKLVPASLS
ncbi:MAG: hypothetical protein ABI723_27255 [Bacteroidia bacterium]